MRGEARLLARIVVAKDCWNRATQEEGQDDIGTEWQRPPSKELYYCNGNEVQNHPDRRCAAPSIQAEGKGTNEGKLQQRDHLKRRAISHELEDEAGTRDEKRRPGPVPNLLIERSFDD